MVVIKWESLHASIEMQRVIVLLYAQVVHLIVVTVARVERRLYLQAIHVII